MDVIFFHILADAASGIRGEVTIVAVATRGITGVKISEALRQLMSSIKAY